MGGKKCRKQKSPSFTAHFFAGSDVGQWLCPTHKIFLPAVGGFLKREKQVNCAGRRALNQWKNSAPNLGMWGRKILLVGKFFGRLSSQLFRVRSPAFRGKDWRILGPAACGLGNLPTHKIFLPAAGGFINRKTVALARAEGIERVEDPGPESRNFWQENFVGRKIFRRLTSPLTATLPAGVIQEGSNPNVCGCCAAGARVW